MPQNAGIKVKKTTEISNKVLLLSNVNDDLYIYFSFLLPANKYVVLNTITHFSFTG